MPGGRRLGLRAEHTASSLAIPTGEEFENEFLNLFPSANASYRFDRSRRIRLSYSRRVQRPSASVLNPVDRSTDPLTRRIGNPAIEPQFTHSISLNAWPQDLGYFVGYRIASLRYARESAPRLALAALLQVDDYAAFLSDSGYESYLEEREGRPFPACH